MLADLHLFYIGVSHEPFSLSTRLSSVHLSLAVFRLHLLPRRRLLLRGGAAGASRHAAAACVVAEVEPELVGGACAYLVVVDLLAHQWLAEELLLGVAVSASDEAGRP